MLVSVSGHVKPSHGAKKGEGRLLQSMRGATVARKTKKNL